jgi:hypothetical protein
MDFQVYSRLYELAALQALRPVVNPTFRVPRTATPLAETSPLAAALAAVAPVAMTPTSVSPSAPPAPSAAPAGAALGRVVPISAPVSQTATATTNASALAKAAEDLEFKVDVVDSGDIDFNVDVDEQVAAIVPAMAPVAHSPVVEVASKATPDEDSTFGTYMMVKKPGEAADNPVKALELALMSRQWGDAVLLAQRILEHESRYKPDGLKALGIMIACFGRDYTVKGLKGQVRIDGKFTGHIQTDEVLVIGASARVSAPLQRSESVTAALEEALASPSLAVASQVSVSPAVAPAAV